MKNIIHFGNSNNKNSISGTVFDIYSEQTDNQFDHQSSKNKQRKQKKPKNKPNYKLEDELNPINNNLNELPNCKCECRSPFLPINHLNDKRYFNQITTGGQLNCAFPCNSPYFSKTEQTVTTFW